MRTPPAHSRAVRAAATPPPKYQPSPNGMASEAMHHNGKRAFITTMSRSASRSAA